MQWEMAIITELHTRLESCNLMCQVSTTFSTMKLRHCVLMLAQCFVSAEKTFMFDDASVMVLPHYKHGSLLVYKTHSCYTVYTHVHCISIMCPLQDLANAHGAHLSDSFLSYYTAEVLDIVDSLHQCGILHTDIKPDNFMLTDIRWVYYTTETTIF